MDCVQTDRLRKLNLHRVGRHGFDFHLPRKAVAEGSHKITLTIADHADGTIVALPAGASPPFARCFEAGKVVGCGPDAGV